MEEYESLPETNQALDKKKATSHGSASSAIDNTLISRSKSALFHPTVEKHKRPIIFMKIYATSAIRKKTV